LWLELYCPSLTRRPALKERLDRLVLRARPASTGYRVRPVIKVQSEPRVFRVLREQLESREPLELKDLPGSRELKD
jgi:hypothetical protein